MTRLLAASLLLILPWAAGCSQPSATDGQRSTPGPQDADTSAASALRSRTGKIVDLTHPFDEQTIYWPTEEGFRFLKRQAGLTEAGYFYAANVFTTPEHGGTHIDAPIHFFKDRDTVDQIALERLVGLAAVIDVTRQCNDDRDYQIGVADLQDWEQRQGRQLVDCIVLLYTGSGRKWPQREAYLGTDAQGPAAVSQLHFPGLDPQAARWLVEHRQIKAIGIDTPSIDYGQSSRFASHVTLFEHNIPAFENVANLDQLPAHGATVIALPMKIGGGSGGPLRIIALLDSEV